MELVVDTNVLFSALIAEGKTREIIITADVELFVPEYFFVELSNNLAEVEEKTGLDRSELNLLLDLLFEQLRIVPREEFEDQVTEAEELIASVDPDDVPFLALALYLDAGIWTDDVHFQGVGVVDVWRTPELVAHLE